MQELQSINIEGPAYSQKSIKASNIYIFFSKHSDLHKIRVNKYLYKWGKWKREGERRKRMGSEKFEKIQV